MQRHRLYIELASLNNDNKEKNDQLREGEEGSGEQQDTPPALSTHDCDDCSTLDKDESASSTNSDNEVDTAVNDHTDKEEMLYQQAMRCGIALEDIERTKDGTAAVGTILVRNECYAKNVGARYSTDHWASFQDTPAQWVEGVEGGEVDRFEFCVPLPEGSYLMDSSSTSTGTVTTSKITSFHAPSFEDVPF